MELHFFFQSPFATVSLCLFCSWTSLNTFFFSFCYPVIQRCSWCPEENRWRCKDNKGIPWPWCQSQGCCIRGHGCRSCSGRDTWWIPWPNSSKSSMSLLVKMNSGQFDSFVNILFANEFLNCMRLWLQYTLMRDPVILPSSKITIDRPVIQRHLLSDSVTTIYSL